MDNKPLWLNEYANIINKIREKISTLQVKDEQTLEYAIIRLFSKATLSMCEIYTLLKEGYPHGAFALSRQIYETIVIMNYLIKHKTDEDLLNRFFDDVEISKIIACRELKKTITELTNIADSSPKDDFDEQLQQYKKKYPNFCERDFTNYWWVYKGCSFAKLAKETDFPKNYMYKATSSVVHMSLFNSLVCVGKEQEGILIGATYDGIEQAGWYSMLCFYMAMDMLNSIFNLNLNDLISAGKTLLDKI